MKKKRKVETNKERKRMEVGGRDRRDEEREKNELQTTY